MTLHIESFPPGGPRAAEFAALRERIGYAGPDDGLPPGAECLLARAGGEPVARAALLVVSDLHGAPGPSGVVGWYEATDGAAGSALLRHAREVLAGRGVARILGPMNGSTWARYRLALPPGPGEPRPRPFLTEPVNPPEYPEHFRAAGFSVAAEYESRLAPPAGGGEEERAGELAARGVTVRPLDLARFGEELEAVFRLSLEAFSGNPYYTPIGFAPFRAAYERIRPLLDPELVRLARDAEGRLLGFVFAFPDPLDRAPDRPPRVVLKTLATAPEARGMGLGSFLTAEVGRVARERGAPSVIHALMHAENASTRISGRLRGSVFRRYALYGWTP